MIKKIVFCLLAVALVFTATACGNITLPDYSFSEDGKSEATLFFAALNSQNYEGSVTWKFIAEKQGEDTETMTFTIKTKKYGEDKKSYMHYVDGETDIATINDITKNYYIDNVAKTVSTESGNIGGQFLGMAMMSSMYGRVNFQDETEFSWNLVSKKTATIKDANGKDIKTVEFEYAKASTTQTPLENDVTLRLNFRSDFPSVVRMQFDLYEGEEVGTLTVFITELGGVVLDEDFVPPSESEGYTDISPVE